MGLIYQLHGGRQHGSAEKWPAMVAGQAAEQHSHPDLSGAPIILLKNKKKNQEKTLLFNFCADLHVYLRNYFQDIYFLLNC